MPLPNETVSNNVASNPYALLQEQVQRRRAIADALLQQSLSPSQGNGEMVSGHYIGTALPNAIQKIAGLMVADRLQKRGIEDQSKLMQQYNTAAQGAVADWQKLFSQNPQQAVAQGLASPYPQVQGVAKEFAGKMDSRYKEVNGQLIDTWAAGGTPQKAGDFRETYGPVTTGPGGTPVQIAKDTGKANFGHSSTFVSVANMPENKLLGVAGEEAYKGLQQSKEHALGAQQALANLQSARAMLSSGQVWQNYGAQYVPEIKSILGALGQPLSKEDEAKLYNSQAAQQVLLNATMKAALESESARGMNTKAEQAAIKASAADPNAPMATRMGALDAAIGGLANTINQHSLQVTRVTSPTGNPSVDQQLAAPNALIRSAYQLNPIQLPADRYIQDANGLYQLKPELLGGAPQVQATPQPTPQPTSQPQAPQRFIYDAQGNRVSQ